MDGVPGNPNKPVLIAIAFGEDDGDFVIAEAGGLAGPDALMR